MMLTQLINIQRNEPFILACSGGSDSMAIADFYLRGKKSFTAAYYHHGTLQADEMHRHVSEWCGQNAVGFAVGRLSAPKPKDQSPEEHWRNERYKWLLSFGKPVITCHHLDDAMEGYLFSCLHGNPKVIPVRNGLVVRPFLTNRKSDLTQWCIDHGVKWVEDKSNSDVSGPRNRIRHRILPECMLINPGLEKVIRKRIIAAMKEAS
jgi:tRNA(Ile)-lysidine synthase